MADARRRTRTTCWSITSFNEHEPGFRLPYRDQSSELLKRTRPRQKDCYACMEWNADWFCNDLEAALLRGPRPLLRHRGYGMQGGGDSGFNWKAAGFGAAYKEKLLRPVTTLGLAGLAGFAECLARFENRVEIDPSGQVDVFGIPILKIHMTWSDNETALLADMAETAAEMLDAAGVKNIGTYVVMDGSGVDAVTSASAAADARGPSGPRRAATAYRVPGRASLPRGCCRSRSRPVRR